MIESSLGYCGKLSGAGQGGCIFVYVPNDDGKPAELIMENLKGVLSKEDVDIYGVSICDPGLQVRFPNLHEKLL